MNHEIGLGAYFHENAPARYDRTVINRAVNALRRKGIATMDELCAFSWYDIKRIRALGVKSLSLVQLMMEKYNGGKED